MYQVLDACLNSNLLERTKELSKTILQNIYGTYPVHNAFTNVDFGDNAYGVFGACLNDFMHYSDSGTFIYIADVAFFGLTESKQCIIEELMISTFNCIQSSVLQNFPRFHLSNGFSKNTLLTTNERIGLLFCLHVLLTVNSDAQSIYRKAIQQQQLKYITFPFKPGLNQHNIETIYQHWYSIPTGQSKYPCTKELIQKMTSFLIECKMLYLLNVDYDNFQLHVLFQSIWPYISKLKTSNELLSNLNGNDDALKFVNHALASSLFSNQTGLSQSQFQNHSTNENGTIPTMNITIHNANEEKNNQPKSIIAENYLSKGSVQKHNLVKKTMLEVVVTLLVF